jgi:hypothetical protein
MTSVIKNNLLKGRKARNPTHLRLLKGSFIKAEMHYASAQVGDMLEVRPEKVRQNNQRSNR